MQASYDALFQEDELLKAKYAALLESTEKIIAERDALKQRVEELGAAIQRLTAMLFGRRSERRIDSPQQALLFASDEVVTEEEKAILVAREQALTLSDNEIIDAYHKRQRRKPVAKQSQSGNAFVRTGCLVS